MINNELRQSLFYTREDLRELLQRWSGTSDHNKRAAIEDAVRRLEAVPVPDDLDDEETIEELGERIEALARPPLSRDEGEK